MPSALLWGKPREDLDLGVTGHIPPQLPAFLGTVLSLACAAQSGDSWELPRESQLPLYALLSSRFPTSRPWLQPDPAPLEAATSSPEPRHQDQPYRGEMVL